MRLMPYRYALIRGERGASMCLVMLLCHGLLREWVRKPGPVSRDGPRIVDG
jgi:hypothetical protein